MKNVARYKSSLEKKTIFAYIHFHSKAGFSEHPENVLQFENYLEAKSITTVNTYKSSLPLV